MQTAIVLLGCLIVIFSAVLILLVPYALARKRKYGFTFIPQGEILPVMAGESCVGYLSHLQGWEVLPDGKVVKVGASSSLNWWETAIRSTMEVYHRLFGVYFYGIPPFRQLWAGKFSWNKWINQGGVDVLVDQTAKPISSVFLEYPYGYRFPRLETKPGDSTSTVDHRSSLVIPVHVDALFNVCAANVHTMIFPEVTWLIQLVAFKEGILRPLVGKMSFEELIGSDKGAKGNIAEQIMRALCGEDGKTRSGKDYDPVELAKRKFTDPRYTNEELNEILHRMPVVIETGVYVTRIDIRNIGIDADKVEAERLLKLVNGPAEASKVAEATVTEAEAKARAITAVGKAEAGAVQARVQAYAAAGQAIGSELARGDTFAAALGHVPGLKQLVVGSNASVILGSPSDTDEQGPAQQRATPQQPPQPQPNAGQQRGWRKRGKRN